MWLEMEIVNPEGNGVAERLVRWNGHGGTIGRAPDNDWVVPDPTSEISRCHARVEYIDGVYFLEDTSTNGVFINGPRNRLGTDVRHALNDGDEIAIGTHRIRVILRAAEPGEQNEPMAEEKPADPDATYLAAAATNRSGADTQPIPEDWWMDEAASEPAPAEAPETGTTGARPEPEVPAPSANVPPEPASAPKPYIPPLPEEAEAPMPEHESVPEPEPRPTPAVEPEAPQAAAEPASTTPIRPQPAAEGFDGPRKAMLHRLVEGVMGLLHKRAQFKNRLHVPVTLIASTQNNPLKFSADADDALHTLLEKNNPRYLDAEAAVDAAVDELHRHEAARDHAMRKAFDALIDRLHPARVEAGRKKGGLWSKLRNRGQDPYRVWFDETTRYRDRCFQQLFLDVYAREYEAYMNGQVEDEPEEPLT